ncbi:ATP-binding protein [Caldimonas brevitalea]|uniref:histidine kinase n=1 Tax=Caldimonas brevitalea TaxID=413882 RepID=A0A0G3BK49_9BURK|nr:ATP-binding protein [Caldimonas brevitalea]AKJ29824.1 sensory box histidine kinase/response regulator [Caldimonas brevitalea]
MTAPRRWALDRVRTRLLAAFGLLLLAAISLAAVGWLGMRHAQRAVAGFEDELMPNLADALELAERTTQLAAIAPRITEWRDSDGVESDRLRAEQLLGQIRHHALDLQATGEFGALLARLEDEVRRDLAQLVALTRQKVELQRRLDAQMRRLEQLGDELHRPRAAAGRVDPSLAAVWSSLVLAVATDSAAALGSLEADVEASLLSVQRRDVLSAYPPRTAQTVMALASGADAVLALRRSMLELERSSAYLVVLMRANATELGDAVSRYVGGLQATARERSEAIRRSVRVGETGMLLVALACLGIAAGAAGYVRRLVGQIENITAVMSRLAQGDTAQPTPATRRRDELGALARTFEVFRDALLAKQRLVHDLHAQNEMIAAVHSSMTDALAVFDPDHRLLLWNPQLTQLLEPHGVRPSLGLSAARLLAGLPAGTTWAAPGQTARRPLSRRERIAFAGYDHVELQLPGGQVLDTRTRRVPGTGAVMLVTDLSARRAVESQLQHAQKMEVLGQLTGGVAHDFNNYLGTILGTLPLLEAELPSGSPAQARLARIRRAATGAAAQTRRLLAFARRQPLQAEVVPVDEAIEEMRDLIEYSAGPQVQVDLALGAGDACVEIDRGQLENALLNLVLNSGAAMPTGGRLTVQSEADPQQVRLRIEDSGCGIPEGVLGKVFEPFFTTKAPGEGSGLGLSTVYGFVKQSGGDIRIESQADAGTTVWLTFRRLPRPAAVQPDPVPGQPLPGLAGLTVLVVDDDDSLRETVTEMLQAAGARPLAAASGETALTALQQHEGVGLVLSDVCLGAGMDGWRLRQIVQSRHPALPIGLMSGLGPEGWQSPPPEHAAVPVLHKPFDLRTLLHWLGGLLPATGQPAAVGYRPD